jgi:succinylglutamic semialdehyde dehydrogenase
MSVHETIDDAVRAARMAQVHWSAADGTTRQSVVHGFAERVRSHKSELVELISRETGKPRWESGTEVDAMVNKVALSIRAQEERRSETVGESAGVRSATRYKPHGVVAVLGPFNFPGHLPNGHIVPALLAGNTVVFKPSELTPLVGARMVELWQSDGPHRDLIQLVQGGREVGEALVTHPAIDGVFFTGSIVAGRAISRALADHPGKIAALEMGGNNSLVVWDVADLNAAAYMTIQSAYLTAGQRCSCARRLIISNDKSGDRFIDALIAKMSRLRVGVYTDEPEPFMGPVINAATSEKLLAAQQSLVARGGRAVVEMKSLRGMANLLAPGLIDVTQVRDRADEELFGPLLQLIRVTEFDDAIAEANNTRYGLAAGLLCDERARWERFFREARAGVINWNRPLTGASSALPFGGVGDSGNHRPSAYFAADYCSYPVASLESERVVMPAMLSPGIDR